MNIHKLVLVPVSFAFGVTAMLFIALAVTAPMNIAYAQDEEQTETQTVETTVSNEAETEKTEESPAPTFSYVAKECDALTYMVRQSLNIFDEANDDLSLSNEAVIYAETNIVQEIGPRMLAIGESVSVDSALVEKYARSSQDLTPDQIAAWAQYTDNVDFELEDVQPSEDVSEAVKPQAERDQAIEDAAQSSNDADPDGDGLSDADTVNTDEDNASIIWWVVGGGSVAGLWYLLYRRSDEA